jgi:hypothetical protein
VQHHENVEEDGGRGHGKQALQVPEQAQRHDDEAADALKTCHLFNNVLGVDAFIKVNKLQEFNVDGLFGHFVNRCDSISRPISPQVVLEPILRLLNLQLQRQRCSRLERFFKVEQNNFQIALGYSLSCKFFQRWRCNSRS